jgi:hypothetical protein
MSRLSSVFLDRRAAYMEQEYFPYLECSCAGCAQTMPLPRSSRLGKSPNPQVSPTDAIREIFVNPACGHVCDYTESNVRWRPVPHVAPDRPEQPFSALVEWNCDIGSCDTRVVVQRPTRGKIEPAELLREARTKWQFCGARCPKECTLVRVPEGASAERWVSDL